METKLYLHEVSEEDKRKFYSQEILEGFSKVRIWLCLAIGSIFSINFIMSYVIKPHMSSTKAGGYPTIAVALLLSAICFYTLSYVRFIQRISTNVVKTRIILNNIAGVLFALSLCSYQYSLIKTALKTKTEENWIELMATLLSSTYMTLLVNLISPVWYLKVLVLSNSFIGTIAAFAEVGHPDIRWIIVKNLVSFLYIIGLAALGNYMKWIFFLKTLTAESWNTVYSDILDRNLSAIAVLDQNREAIYSNTEFRNITKGSINSFFQKITNLKKRNSTDSPNLSPNTSPTSRKLSDRPTHLSLNNLDDPSNLMNLEESITKTTRARNTRPSILNTNFRTLEDLLKYHYMLLEGHKLDNQDQAIFDGIFSNDSQCASYEIILRPLVEHKKIIVILNNTTERDLIVTLESNNEYKDQLLASVSHNLRTPLNGNLGFLQAAMDDSDVPDLIRNKYFVPAFRCGRLLSHFINDILDYSKVLTENIALSLELKPLKETLEYCYNLLEHAFSAKNLTFNLVIDEHVPTLVRTDHGRLTQIVLNLLGNALKFTMKGSIEIEAMLIEDHDIKISVKDTGIGVQREVADRLLEEKHRPMIGKLRNHSTRGIGIGLKVANILSQMLDATKNQGIKIKSDMKDGSVFSFTLTNVGNVFGNQSPSHSFLSGIAHDKDLLIPISDRKEIEYSIINSPVEDREVTKQMDAQMTVNSLRKWSMFKLGNVCAGDDTAPMVAESQREHKIALIVDDDAFNILALKSVLKQLDITSEFANNGKEAVEKILSKLNVYDIVFMDCQMPIMNGYEATTLLTAAMQEGKIPKMPIIGCTAFSSKDKLEECIRCGMNEVINKPVLKNKLLDIIQKYVG